MAKFVVNRSEWNRGNRFPNGTALLNQHGMCCLGFVCLQLGATEIGIRGHGEPWEVDRFSDSGQAIFGVLMIEDEGRRSQAPLVGVAIEINDDSSIDDATRERQLSALFAEHGHEMEFIDG